MTIIRENRAASEVGRSTRDRDVSVRVQLAYIGRSVYTRRILASVLGNFNSGCVSFPRQETVRRINVRKSSYRTYGAFGTKILVDDAIVTVGIPTRDAGLAPPGCVASVGLLVPSARDRHLWIPTDRALDDGGALRLTETRVLVAIGSYRDSCISGLRSATIVTPREEHDGGDKNQRLHHHGTNLSNTIVARRNRRCKSGGNRLVTRCHKRMSHNLLHGEMPGDSCQCDASRENFLPI
jgi:hypothetical protein